MYGCGKDCLILIPFRLPQLSCFHLSLKCFSSDSDICRCGNQTPASGPVLLTLLLFPLVPLSYQVLCLYIFFTTGQGLLSALSWGSACPSVSEVIFLMYPWREMYSTSTYSSAILFFTLFLMFCSFIMMCLFLGAPKSLQMVTAAMKLKDAYSLEEKL